MSQQTKPEIESRCYTTKQVATILNLSEDSVYELVRRKMIPTLDTGTAKKAIPIKEFEAWYASRIVPARAVS